ncbi:MAG: P1 family peptidase [Candidatus Tectomicrobia bacterium]|nr:P1 family peptidase [Candidatus Tectomicrobia bacterium]
MGSLTEIPGIRVGHATDERALTGCTVILCEHGAVGGVDVRGGATGTRDLGPLDPSHIAPHVHAILLSGGSAFGLDAAGGVMRYLEERGHGFRVGRARVPIVPAAIIFDLSVGDPTVRPTVATGYAACEQATADPVVEGSVGAGTGATVGKARGIEYAMKGGVGSASLAFPDGVVVAALVVVNCWGDVIKGGQIIAGAREPDGGFADATRLLRTGELARAIRELNTTLGVVATNARFTKVELGKIAQLAHQGLTRTIAPVHTMFDGDLVFALSMGSQKSDLHRIGFAAADALAEAVVRAVTQAQSRGGVPCHAEITGLAPE